MSTNGIRNATRVSVVAIVTVAALATGSPAFAQGCAMCKTALDGPPDALTEAFNVSAMFLMLTPYAVVGTIAGWIYLAVRRRDRLAPPDDTVHELE